MATPATITPRPTTTRTPRLNTPERWQAALRRALAEGIETRQLAGCGMWIATSSSEPGTAYEVTPWGCECPAGQFDDPVCKHRAALRERFGVLILDDEPDPEPPPTPTVCADCQNSRWYSLVSPISGRTYQRPCQACLPRHRPAA